MCDEANTPSFRPHSSRKNQLGFPARQVRPAYCDASRRRRGALRDREQWLARLKPDVLICSSASMIFQGMAGLKNFREELDAFLKHTLARSTTTRPRRSSPSSRPPRSRISPPPWTARRPLQNPLLASYTSVMEAVANEHGVLFVDAFRASQAWYANQGAAHERRRAAERRGL